MKMAEGVRFELTREQSPLPVFKTGALNHSATLPSQLNQAFMRSHERTEIEQIGSCNPFANPLLPRKRQFCSRAVPQSRQCLVDCLGGFVVLLPEQVRVNPQRDGWV